MLIYIALYVIVICIVYACCMRNQSNVYCSIYVTNEAKYMIMKSSLNLGYLNGVI